MLQCSKRECVNMCGNERERERFYILNRNVTHHRLSDQTIPTNARDMGFHITAPACTRSSYIPPEPMDHTAMGLKTVKRSLEIF